MTDTPPTTPPSDRAEAATGGGRGDALAVMRAAGQGTLLERMEIELTEVSADRCCGSMKVEGNTQPYGLLHGGASVVLAETLGSIAAQMHAGEGGMAVGVDINATHHRPATKGQVHGVATAVHRGRTTACYDVVISDDEGRRICTSRITCAVRPAKA